MVNGGRPDAPAILKMHSVKNRFLMRAKNMTADLYRRHWLATTLRDLVVIGACVFHELSSLPAFWNTARCLPRAIAKRRRIMARRIASDEYLALWFRIRSRPLEPLIHNAVVEERLHGPVVVERR
jgi:hypothetical protein